MHKTLLWLLALSVFFLTLIDVLAAHRFFGLYYILWLGGVGVFVWRHRVSLEEKLVAWNVGSFKKFLLLGLVMILIEEAFAGFSTHLGVTHSLAGFIVGILQFWGLNLIVLPGFIIGWYLLLRRIVYSRREVFVLVGIFGLFSEHIYTDFLGFPLAGILLILPTMCTYALIIAPSLMSFRTDRAKPRSRVVKYVLGLIVPILVSIPFVLVLWALRAHYPGVFPPSDLVS